VISPSATSTFITDISDNGLVWRTSPSDIYQSAALAAYVEKLLEPDIRAELMLMESDDIKLSVLHKGDAYGSGLALAFEGDPGNVQINGASVSAAGNDGLYERVDYGDPDDPEANPENYQAAVDAALASKPHIIAIFGTTEGITDVLVPIEAGWDSTSPTVTHRPRYLMADGVYSVTELFNAIGSESNELRQRIVGSVPGTTSSLFSAFVNGYNSKFSGDQAKPETFGAAGAYDAVYLLAYAAVANASKPETGANLALGLHRMVAGDPVDVGKSKINTAFQKLSGADPIDFNGASGPLGFDVETGEAPSDVQIWCVTTDSNNDLTNAFSGVYLDSAAFVPGESPPLNGSSFAPVCNFD
jgi:branched-chain amino acid transport system substrate-binding protein